jgi:G3E family GTPase
MTKIEIVSGFLGAGKTTLIKKLLKEVFQGEKVVLIENEFGEIGIDGGFLKDAGIQVTEMNSGCICCSLVGDFGKALQDVLEQFAPDRIIIEPSGVGKLSDVKKAVIGVADETKVDLNSSVTVVDGQKCEMYLDNFGEFYANQVEAADTIVISRSQKMDQKDLEGCVAKIRELNADATIITTPWEEISGAKILEAIEHTALNMDLPEDDHHDHGEGCTCGCHDHDHEGHEHHHHHDHEGHEHHHDHDHEGHEHHHDHDHEGHEHHHDHDHEGHEHHHDHDHEGHEHHHDHDHGENCTCGCHDHDHDHHDHHGHHHADDIFTSWGMETPQKYSRERLEDILAILSVSSDYGTILRAKGILPAEDGTWHHFDLVPGEYEIREGAADYTGRICVIGADLKEDKIKELF